MKRFALLVALVLGIGPAAAQSDSAGKIGLFQSVLEKVTTDYVDRTDMGALVKAAIDGMLASHPSAKASTIAAEQLGTPAEGVTGYVAAFASVLDAARVERGEADDGAMVQSAIAAMLASLDPYSIYVDPETFRDMQIGTKNRFGGLGLEITMENGIPKVITAIANTPAAKGGLAANDEIIAIDAEPTEGFSLSQVVEKLRGAIGTPVTLSIRRRGTDQPFDLKLVRAEIATPTAVSYATDGGIGYIRIEKFNNETALAFEKAMAAISAALGADQVKGYVIDLRNNSGGPLDPAIDVTDAILDSGDIVLIRTRAPRSLIHVSAETGDLAAKKPVVVLVNEGTAHAAEVVAAGLQDQRRATVVGMQTAGLGTEQVTLPLADGGALQLTSKRHYAPSGRDLEGVGVKPDVVVATPSEGDAAAADPQLIAAFAHLGSGPQAEAKAPVEPGNAKEQIAKVESGQAVDLGKRVALVIGNSAYAHTPTLANPGNDAADVATALRQLGFAVTVEQDLTKQGMDRVFGQFARAVQGADAALFYYAGHAMQFEGVNYMVPVDAKLEDETVLPYQMARLDDVLADMNRAAGVRIVVLDACRDNPLENQLKRSLARTRGAAVSRGLAKVSQSEGYLVAFATRPNTVADDGEGRNSPFTAAFLKQVGTAGLEVGLLFRRVTGEVRRATDGRQVPELLISLESEFYFRPE